MKVTIYRHILLLLTIGTLLLGHAFAQPPQKPFRKITTSDGLPQSFISGLVQDKYGFVWISTRNGLVRYDGFNFQLYQHNTRDSNSLSSNLIICLKYDSINNHILIEHEGGDIDDLDAAGRTIERLTRRPLYQQNLIKPLVWTGWLKSRDGSLWCANYGDGLYQYNWSTNKVKHLNRNNGMLLSDSLFGLAEDKAGQIWSLSGAGISCYNPATNKSNTTAFPKTLGYSISNFTSSHFVNMHLRQNGEWMFSDTGTIIFFQPANKTFRYLKLRGSSYNGIHFIQTGPDGNEYFELNGVVFRYNDQQGLKAVGETDVENFRDAKSMLIDRSGLIWLGTNTAGIRQIDVNAPSFESHAEETPFHYYLLKKEFGLALDQLWNWPADKENFKLVSYFFRSEMDHKGRLWMGLRNKVGYWDTHAQRFIMLPTIPEISNGDRMPLGIRGLSMAPNGRLWIVSDAGAIFYFDEEQQNWIKFKDPSFIRGRYSPKTIIVDLLAENNKLWLSTFTGEGLLMLNINTGAITQINEKTAPGVLPTAMLQRLQPDPANPNILWIGTYEGLVQMDKRTFKTKFFSIAEGLPDNTIYAIVPDNNGYLWLSTNQGLCRFQPISHQVRNFKVENGLPGNEFNRFNYFKMPDGRLAFGGVDGWVIFNPTLPGVDNFKPEIAFTRLRIHNKPVSYALNRNIVKQPINELEELELAYDQNTLSFGFAGLEFNQPTQIKYRYQLMGYDNDWIVTENPMAAYTQLPPGTYTLRINCTNTNGQWSSFTRKLIVIIRPPWWFSWWAIFMYCLVAVIITYVGYRMWIQRQAAMQKILQQQQEAKHLRDLDEMKTRFFGNVTHEFRTPLSLIVAPLHHLIERQKDPLAKKQLISVQRNANQLLELVNQSLDMAKLEAAGLQVTLSKGHLNDFLQEQAEAFADAASAKSIHLNIQVPYSHEFFQFDADKLHTIIFNLLSNAIKFTPVGGNIDILVKMLPTDVADTKTLVLQVKDNGIGIAAHQQALIFNRFYQVDDSSTRHYNGTGIGLSLSKELAEMLNGKLTVESNLGQGSTFTLRMPLQTANNDNLPLYAPGYEAVTVIEETLQLPEAIVGAGDDQPLILVAEDNPELNDFIVEILRPAYRVVAVTDGLQGLEIARAQLPDVIVSDWMMPHMDGLDFCREIRKDLTTNHIAFIQLTAKTAQVSRIKALQTGADDFLTKPFIAEELKLRVKNLLERQRRLREKMRAELASPQHPMEENIAETVPVEDPFLIEVYKLVEAHIDDSTFGVEEIAKGIGMSRANLHRKLKATVGITPGHIIRNYRLQQAAKLLKNGYNSSETAYKTGFETPAYFTKCFRDFFGITPTEYAKQP